MQIQETATKFLPGISSLHSQAYLLKVTVLESDISKMLKQEALDFFSLQTYLFNNNIWTNNLCEKSKSQLRGPYILGNLNTATSKLVGKFKTPSPHNSSPQHSVIRWEEILSLQPLSGVGKSWTIGPLFQIFQGCPRHLLLCFLSYCANGPQHSLNAWGSLRTRMAI